MLQKGRGWALADVDRGGGAVSAEATAARGEGACGGVGGAGGLRNHSEGEWLTGGAAAKEWGEDCWGRGKRGRREAGLRSLSHSEGKGWTERWCS